MQRIMVSLLLMGVLATTSFRMEAQQQLPTLLPPYPEEPARPQPTTNIQPWLDQCEARMQARKPEEGLAILQAGQRAAHEAGDRVGEAILLRKEALSLSGMERAASALAKFAEVVLAWERAGDTVGAAQTYGYIWVQAGEFAPVEARAAFEKALALGRAEITRPKAMIEWMRYIAGCSVIDGHLPEAQRACDVCHEILERIGFPLLPTVSYINTVGSVQQVRGDLDGAERSFRTCREMLLNSPEHDALLAIVLNNIGGVLKARGDLEEAGRIFSQSLEIVRRIGSVPAKVATALNNLGEISRDRGDLAAAEAFHKEALAIRETLDRDPTRLSASLNYLGAVRRDRGDLIGAENLFREALETDEIRVPVTLAITTDLNNLGETAMLRGDITAAETFQKRALAIREKQVPDGLDTATSLNNVALIALRRNDSETAEKLSERALAICEYRHATARPMILALEILGKCALRRNRPELAAAFFERAIGVVESQRSELFGPESRRLFLERNVRLYSQCAEAYLANRRPEAAFFAMERARARSLVETLAERKSDIARQLPPNLAARQSALENDRRIAESKLQAAIDHNFEAAQKSARGKLESLSVESRRLESEIRRRLPGYAALRFPKPLDVVGAQKSLDPGTLALCYLQGEESVTLFALTARSFHAYRLPLSRPELERRAAQAYRALREPNSARDEYDPILKDLYRALLFPARAEIASAKRLLICCDGPLQKLPFAALVTDRNRYLAQDLPIHDSPSLTAYRALRDGRGGGSPSSVLALGDPIYDGLGSLRADSQRTIPGRTMGAAMGMRLQRLPQTRSLAIQVRRLFGAGSAVLLDKNATAEKMTAGCSRASVLHIGCHGYADDQDPFGSWLALTPSRKGETGLFYAWQAIGLHLNCDLVTLAACETGLGVESPGEGVLGLARAFQSAGARSILVTRWSVDADSTERLMLDFYRGWRLGKLSKDEALRRAQLQMIRSNRAYLWAGLSLNGDWK